MTSPALPTGRYAATTFLSIALLGSLAFSSYAFWRTEQALVSQEQVIKKNQESLGAILNEMTRIRIEQSAEGQGPTALLEKLKVYAPLTADARVTEPDFQNAKKELLAIVRAFEACGKQAWGPIMERLREADADHGASPVCVCVVGRSAERTAGPSAVSNERRSAVSVSSRCSWSQRRPQPWWWRLRAG